MSIAKALERGLFFGMTVEAILNLIPEDILDFLTAETRVDHQVKKLKGNTVFKLILFSMLNSDKLSLRVMEAFLSSAKFKKFAGTEQTDARYNSIRDRICTINAEYFDKLFQSIFTIYNKQLAEEKSIVKADSTYVSIAARLVTWSLQNGTKSHNQKQVKYSINLKGSLPCHVKVFTEKSLISEDLALGQLIESSIGLEESVVVFDRGLQSRKVFDKFSADKILFVGRSNSGKYIKETKKNHIKRKPANSSVTITSDQIGYLRNGDNKLTTSTFRLVNAIIDTTGEKICFVTNLLKEDAYEIATIYKSRWEIEVFFKFIKQHLNCKHLVSRNSNGLHVMIYMTMILAILILVYKKLNNIKGYKIAKLKFEIELDNLLIKEIVLICGGNPNAAAHLWNSS